MNQQNQGLWAFVIYSVCYEAIIWGLFGWGVFHKGVSGWWLLLAIWLSCSQWKPESFGIGGK